MSGIEGLIPKEVLRICISEAARQFDQNAWWIRQRYGPNGQAIEDSYGQKQYDDPIPVPARAVTVNREFLDEHGYHRIPVTQWYLPPNTGVQYGDFIYGIGDDPLVPHPPILSVSQVPDPANSIYELVTTGWRSRGAP